MSKRPSNLFLKAIIAIAGIFVIYILGSWLLQMRPSADDSDITDDVSQVNPGQMSPGDPSRQQVL